MKKKVVSVILAMTMVASMAMGCGNSSDTTTSDNSTTTTTTNDAAASTEASDAADATADAANGDLAEYIVKGVTEGLSYDVLKIKMDIQCCKDVYYESYRRFFWILNKMRD